jgi:ATPase subunit of ABC transporter with duplicated ATPase domains
MTNSTLTLESVSYVLPDGRTLFSDLSEQFDQRPTALVGRNGAGKTVLARILAGELIPTAGHCLRSGSVYYLAQHVPHQCDLSVAALAGVQPVLDALQRIEDGSTDAVDFDIVGNRWDVRQRLRSELDLHGLHRIEIDRTAACLSGGEVMRVALVGAYLADADFLILDEPTNHLDRDHRRELLMQLRKWPRGLIVVSHDRAVLEQMERIVELSARGLRSYGGNYAFYANQRDAERANALRDLEQRRLEQKREEHQLRVQRERQEHRRNRDSRWARDANQAKILLGRQKERSENSAGRLRTQHDATREQLVQRVRDAAQQVEPDDAVVLRAPNAQPPTRRQVAELREVELPFVSAATRHIDLMVSGQQRIAVIGPNGCGKSTLLRTLAGQWQPLAGACTVHVPTTYLDQHLLELDPRRSVLDHLHAINHPSIATLRMQLAQLGLNAAAIAQPSGLLSGGERLKAALACVLYADNTAQLLLLDEPSNHLDLVSVRALEAMLRQYRGALLVVSHDDFFLDQLNLSHRLQASVDGWMLQTWR